MARLRNHLENLLPPDVVEDFQIFFFDDETAAEDAQIKSANVDSYDYKIEFQVMDDRLKIGIMRNEFDFRGEAQEVFEQAGFDEEEQKYFYGSEKKIEAFINRDLGSSNCIGNYRGTLYFNKISATEKDREKFYYKDIKDRTNLTKKFGGIKLYRDKFRVRPYGEYGDNDFDWLELSARRNRSPAGLGKSNGQWRVGAEQMLGSVYISRNNTNLDDAANRNGIQEGAGFNQLKQVIIYVINEFEKDRQSVGRKLAENAKRNNSVKQQIQQLRQMAEEEKKQEKEQANKSDHADSKSGTVPAVKVSDVVNLLDTMEQEQEEERQEARDESRMLQTLATTGIITNMFMHEIRTLTNNIGQELDAAYEAIQYDHDIDTALNNIRQAIMFKKNFSSWFGVTLESIRKDKRLRKKHNIKEMLGKFLETWSDILDKNDVRLHFECDDDILFVCFEFDIENIISNLISNSLAAFDREMDTILEKREIYISITAEDAGFVIDYYDTGWGLIEKYKVRPELILDAFESSKITMGQEEDGTGMGMWIVNKIVREYNGYIDLSGNRQNDVGFYIRIRMGGKDV